MLTDKDKERDMNKSPEGPKNGLGDDFDMDASMVKVHHHKKEPKKLSDLEGSIPPIKWTKERPRPEFAPIWDDETVEELAKYVDWHKRHPHSITPRKLQETGGHVLGKKILDEENPDFYYTENGIKIKPLKQEFLPPPIGADADLDEVSSVALRTEYQSYIEHTNEDPWFVMSVKDQLEQSHMDGSHTTVKSKPPKGKKLTEFEKEAAWQKLHFGGFEGGGPPISEQHKFMIDRLSIEDKALLIKPRDKVSPWADNHVFSKYTINGTALKAFNQRDLDNKIKVALAKHNNPYSDDKSTKTEEDAMKSKRWAKRFRFSRKNTAKLDESTKSESNFSRPESQGDMSFKMDMSEKGTEQNENSVPLLDLPSSEPISPASSRPSSSKKSKRKSKKSRKVVPERDKYDVMKEKFVVNNSISQHEAKLVKLAKQVTKKAKKGKAVVDTSLNLVEACDKLRILKVTTLLLTKQAEAEMLTPDEESLFLHCFQSAIKMDNVTSNLKPEDQKNDTNERKKLQKILDLLLKYGANIDSNKSKESLSAMHIAALSDNAKMISWLLKNKANPNQLTNTTEYLTPVMLASKFGHVQSVATFVQNGVPLNFQNPLGHTALHIAAKYGQTRMCLFLLRIGAGKLIKDNEGKVAADLAISFTYLSTAQAIAAFTTPINRYQDQMEFMVNEFNNAQKKEKSLHETLMSAPLNLFSNFLDFAQGTAINARRNRPVSFQDAYEKLRDAIKKKWKKINPFHDAESDDEDEGDLDLDRIEQIAQEKLLAENPELAELHAQQQGEGSSVDGGSLEGSDFMMQDDNSSVGGIGDQVVPFEEG